MGQKSIGFNFAKNDFRYCVLSDLTNPPTILEKEKIIYPKNMSTPEMMKWFETQLKLIISKHRPRYISHKISLQLKNLEQIRMACYPQAILNLIAADNKDLSVNSYSSQAINATKFKEPNKTDVYSYLENKVGKNPPHWDKPTMDAALIAWFELL